jgi:ribosomal protein S27AE
MAGDPGGPYAWYNTDEEESLMFVRRCPKCGRIVKADKVVTVGGLHSQPLDDNATCAKCGRVAMDFQGYY